MKEQRDLKDLKIHDVQTISRVGAEIPSSQRRDLYLQLDATRPTCSIHSHFQIRL